LTAFTPSVIFFNPFDLKAVAGEEFGQTAFRRID
jgi:hypothetical protein